MAVFSWLHFSDLYWGSERSENYWGKVSLRLFEDIKNIKEKYNLHYDAIFFTGDLVNSGIEYKQFKNEWLLELVTAFIRMELNPILFTVPGNHDLQRQKLPVDCNSIIRDLRLIEKKTETWNLIESAFHKYYHWWENDERIMPRPVRIKDGFLPGDFLYTFDKDNLSIGILGLNTAFFHLDHMRKDKLGVNVAQIEYLCGKNPQKWIEKHDVSFVISHHPLSWPMQWRKKELTTRIPPEQQLFLHLCGHSHEKTNDELLNGFLSNTQRTFHGMSLISTEQFTHRPPGYIAGQLSFDAGEVRMRIFPRIIDGSYNVKTDTDLCKKEDYLEVVLKYKKKKESVINDKNEFIELISHEEIKSIKLIVKDSFSIAIKDSNSFIGILANILQIEPEQIFIRAIMRSDSTLIIEMPAIAANYFYNLFRKKDLRLIKLGVLAISFSKGTYAIVDNESHRVNMGVGESAELIYTIAGQNSIRCILFDPESNNLAIGSDDSTITLWGSKNRKLLYTLEGHRSYIMDLAFNQNGSILASGSNDSTIKLWNIKNGQLINTLKGHFERVNAVAFNPAGNIIYSGSFDRTIKSWDVKSGRLLHTFIGHEHRINALIYIKGEEILASGSNDNTIRFWDPDDGKELDRFKGHTNNVVSLDYNPRLKILASASYDKTIRIWDISSGNILRTLKDHIDCVDMVRFSTDGQLLASKSKDGTIRLWNCKTWQTVGIIREPTRERWIPGLSFHSHDPLLAIIGSHPFFSYGERCKQIRFWKLNSKILCENDDTTSLSDEQEEKVVQHTIVKIVLVGESNVGKSWLAYRIITGLPPKNGVIKSTHGMQVWTLSAEKLNPAVEIPKNHNREVVLWDMGGQSEYSLVNQLFLLDTTLALVLLDPTRGQGAFEEVKAWNKRFEKLEQNQPIIKILVGAKLEKPSDIIDYQGLENLRTECGFTDYFETSAINGRGVNELCKAIEKAVDWDGLSKFSHPELFQHIHDEIEVQRKQGNIVLFVSDLHRTLGNSIGNYPLTEDQEIAVEDVTKQLATQGIIARSQNLSDDWVLVLQIQEVERYASSLIIAAKNNPRGIPVLELRAIAQAGFPIPGIDKEDRLPRNQEHPVIECSVQLMIEQGICFEHEGLLIFPTLFDAAPTAKSEILSHTVSLYYDFAGAIDNIYASLVSWLVLAKDFGRVRLWTDRAELEVKDGGFCGLRKVVRPGGFAHMDVYFEMNTPKRQREEFISFVDDHLSRTGVDIREHVAITCSCGNTLDEFILHQRIARGKKDVTCPVCDTQHNLTDGAEESRKHNPSIIKYTWALRTKIEMQLRKSTKRVAFELTSKAGPPTRPIRLLHLSDLHFNNETPIQARLQWLLDDIKQDSGLGFSELDFLIISGDFTDKGCLEGFDKAYDFVSGLAREFGLSAERCIFVPGNHDVVDRLDAYERCKNTNGLSEGEWVKQGDIFLMRNITKYPLRFKPFSDSFYHKFLQRPFPIGYAEQGMSLPFWEEGIQFITLNSCWQIDEFHRKRAGLHPEAVAHAISETQKQKCEALRLEQLRAAKPIFRIAVWHHAVTAPDFKMTNIDFLGHLQNNGVNIVLHGDVHELRRDIIGYWHKEKKLHIIGAGSFGARADELPGALPRLYNVLEIDRDFKSLKVYTRHQLKPDGPWDGWYVWPDPCNNVSRVPYYTIKWQV